MESIEEDNSLEAVTQQFVKQHSKIESEHLDINDKDIKRLTICGSLIEEEINDDIENNPTIMENKVVERKPSSLKLNNNVEDIVNQILSPDTAEFINFEKQMSEMSKKKTADNISDDVDIGEEKMFQKNYDITHDEANIFPFNENPELGRTLSSSSNSTGAFSVCDLTQLQQSSEYGKNNNIEHKRSMSSMELQEQQTLERMALQNELETKLEERKRSLNSSLSSRDSDSGSVVSSNGANDKSSDDPMHLMERRHMRSFNRADEYLYAMKEDLAEWLNMLYIEIDIDAENFLGKLETGELLVKVGYIINHYTLSKENSLRIGTKNVSDMLGNTLLYRL